MRGWSERVRSLLKVFFVGSGCSRWPDPWLNGTVGQWCWAALQGIPYTHKECDPAWTMASTLTRDPSNSFTWTLQAHLSSAAHMPINHRLLNLLKSCLVLQFVSSFVLAAQLSIVSPPVFHNLPLRYPALGQRWSSGEFTLIHLLQEILERSGWEEEGSWPYHLHCTSTRMDLMAATPTPFSALQ